MAKKTKHKAVTVELLTSIRDEIAGLRADANHRLDTTGERLNDLDARLGRIEQALVDLGTFLRQLAHDTSRSERSRDAEPDHDD
jgi:hypothetical protein